MLCYHCQKASECSMLRTLHSTSNDFCINDCKNYDAASNYRYRRIAENDDLMRLMYDYFTCRVTKYSEEEVRNAIVFAIAEL